MHQYLRRELGYSREQIADLTEYEIFDVLLRDRARRRGPPPKPLPKDPKAGFIALMVRDGATPEQAEARWEALHGKEAASGHAHP